MQFLPVFLHAHHAMGMTNKKAALWGGCFDLCGWLAEP
jgi:hypothetical protein